MFGLSAISEVPFSSLAGIGGVWNEVRDNANSWTRVDPLNVGFLVLDSSGAQYQVSYRVLGTQSYGVINSVLNSSGQSFVPISNSWQTASTNSNSWVEV